MQKLFTLILFMAGFTYLSAQLPLDHIFDTDGTYTIKPGYTAVIIIEVWGAGGGGGTDLGSRKGGGGGGSALATGNGSTGENGNGGLGGVGGTGTGNRGKVAINLAP